MESPVEPVQGRTNRERLGCPPVAPIHDHEIIRAPAHQRHRPNLLTGTVCLANVTLRQKEGWTIGATTVARTKQTTATCRCLCPPRRSGHVTRAPAITPPTRPPPGAPTVQTARRQAVPSRGRLSARLSPAARRLIPRRTCRVASS